MCERLRRGVRAVRGCKGVVDVKVAERGEAFRELQIVALFFRMKANVFEQKHVAVVQLRDGALRLLADAVAGKVHARIEPVGERLCDGTQRIANVGPPVGTPEVREDDRSRPVLVQPAQRRNCRVGTRVVEDLSVVHREVEVLTHQDALTANVEVG